MLHQEEFIERLKNIIEERQMSSSQFADRIQVPRSSISHLLSGRNKPSLDFVMKVVHSFPEVDISWLLFGKQSGITTTIQQHGTNDTSDLISGTIQQSAPKTDSEIEKIVVLYKNGRFKTYEPS